MSTKLDKIMLTVLVSMSCFMGILVNIGMIKWFDNIIMTVFGILLSMFMVAITVIMTKLAIWES